MSWKRFSDLECHSSKWRSCRTQPPWVGWGQRCLVSSCFHLQEISFSGFLLARLLKRGVPAFDLSSKGHNGKWFFLFIKLCKMVGKWSMRHPCVTFQRIKGSNLIVWLMTMGSFPPHKCFSAGMTLEWCSGWTILLWLEKKKLQQGIYFWRGSGWKHQYPGFGSTRVLFLCRAAVFWNKVVNVVFTLKGSQKMGCAG